MKTETGTKGKPNLAAGSFVSLLSLLAFAIFVSINFRTIEVSGPSMEPTFNTGQRLLASRAWWLVGPIRDNDIVVVEGDEPGETLIKRVYKVSGEQVDWLNVPDNYDLQAGPLIVPEKSLYLLGDNREVSEDSRKFGPVPTDKVVGKIVLKKWF